MNNQNFASILSRLQPRDRICLFGAGDFLFFSNRQNRPSAVFYYLVRHYEVIRSEFELILVYN